MKVLITGDSHVGALKKGLDLLASKGEWPQQVDLTVNPLVGGGNIFRTPFFIDRGDYAEVCTKFRNRFKRFPQAALARSDIIYGFSGPLHTIRVCRLEAWSEYVPSQFVVNEAPISNTLLNQVIQEDCQYLLKFIDFILRTEKKLFVIEAPRPFRHHSALKSTRVEVYQYVDAYYRDFIKQELALRNIPIVALSPECYDEAGFMRECYRHENKNDEHHANADFGEVMMKKILNFLLDEQKY